MSSQEKKVCWIVGTVLLGVLLYTFMKQVRENHLEDDSMLYLLKSILQPLQPFFDAKYPEANIHLEKLKLYKGDKSYTINKNQIFLCIYDEKGEYYPVNALVYVLIHELGHRANTADIGHTPAFHKVFDEILEEADRLGIYNPNIPMIKNYCNSDE